MKSRFRIELVKIYPADLWKFNTRTDILFTISILDLNKTYGRNSKCLPGHKAITIQCVMPIIINLTIFF